MDFNHATILVVEDHIVTRTFLAENLSLDGYEILQAGGLTDAQRLISRAFPDLAVLDLGLPDGDGLELVRRVRAADRATDGIDPDLPILILSGRSGELDRLRGFDRGGDDYVCKPFSYQELQARIGALLRRSQRRPGDRRLHRGPLTLDPLAHRVWLRGAPVDLSGKEFALLRVLASAPERVFTRDELLRSVWGYQPGTATRTLDSHAFRLRQKLAGQGDRYVVNVWGVGFRLNDEA